MTLRNQARVAGYSATVSCRGRHLRGGFTLIEVLVVIAIISALVAMLLPALSAARATAQAIQCGTHMRQISLAFNAYAADHRGNFPGVRQPYREGDGSDPSPFVPRFEWYTVFIGVPRVNFVETSPAQSSYDYLGGYKQHSLPLKANNDPYATGILYCPSATWLSSRFTVSAPLTATSFGLNPFVWRNFNGMGGFSGNANTVKLMLPLAYERLAKPSATMLSGEVLQGQPSPVPYFQHTTAGGSQRQYGEFRHKEAMNVLYFDGHVSRQQTIAANGSNLAWDGD